VINISTPNIYVKKCVCGCVISIEILDNPEHPIGICNIEEECDKHNRL